MTSSLILEKQYRERCRKRLSRGNVSAIFPSINFSIKNKSDVNIIALNANQYVSGVTLPISRATKINRAISGLPNERKEAFYRNVPIVADFETEAWYYQNKHTLEVKKGFSTIKEIPSEVQKLFTYSKEQNKRRPLSWMTLKINYINKLNLAFSTDEVITGLVTACLQHSANELLATISLPPAPLIVGDDASKRYCIKVNEISAKYNKFFDIFNTLYYPLKPSAIDSSGVRRSIIEQVYRLQPNIVIIGTLKSQEFLFPSNKFDLRKPNFKLLINELATYAKSNNALVGWYDKGDFSSSYGMQLIKDGFDFIITPLNGRTTDSGGKGGPVYAYILDEYSYLSWDRFLREKSDHYLNTLSGEKLKTLTPREQWDYRKIKELCTRKEQLKEIHEQLEDSGSLDGYEIRLGANKID